MAGTNPTTTNPTPKRHGFLSRHMASRHGELRIIPMAVVALACVGHLSLPDDLIAEPHWVLPTLEILVLITLTAINPARLTRETRLSRIVSLLLVVAVVATNTFSLAHLVRDLVDAHDSGRDLLLAAFDIWGTNVLAFGLAFWELDRGGPVARHLSDSLTDERRVDFLFPQDTDPHIATMTMGPSSTTRWIPLFTDYLYVSITNSTAFSPTDTMPLTTRAKILMGIEGLVSIALSLLVVARAVNILT